MRKGKPHTLPAVVVDIRVVGVVLNSLLEALEGLYRVILFHVHASNLDPALR